MNWNELKTSKTFWAGITSIIATAGGYFTGAIPAGQAINVVVTALLSIFIRDSIANK